MYKSWAIGATFCIALASGVQAQAQQKHFVVYPAKGGELKANGLYAIEARCSKKADFLATRPTGYFQANHLPPHTQSW